MSTKNLFKLIGIALAMVVVLVYGMVIRPMAISIEVDTVEAQVLELEEEIPELQATPVVCEVLE